jgi:hypothetical protein
MMATQAQQDAAWKRLQAILMQQETLSVFKRLADR